MRHFTWKAASPSWTQVESGDDTFKFFTTVKNFKNDNEWRRFFIEARTLPGTGPVRPQSAPVLPVLRAQYGPSTPSTFPSTPQYFPSAPSTFPQYSQYFSQYYPVLFPVLPQPSQYFSQYFSQFISQYSQQCPRLVFYQLLQLQSDTIGSTIVQWFIGIHLSSHFIPDQTATRCWWWDGRFREAYDRSSMVHHPRRLPVAIRSFRSKHDRLTHIW